MCKSWNWRPLYLDEWRWWVVHTIFFCKYDMLGKCIFWLQNAVEKLPIFLPSWAAMYVVNSFIVIWVLVIGFGFGGWASMANFIKQVDTFGLFAKCYQCPPQGPAIPHHWFLHLPYEYTMDTQRASNVPSDMDINQSNLVWSVSLYFSIWCLFVWLLFSLLIFNANMWHWIVYS